MEANNWGCKAAQPTGRKRAAADLSMSFPLAWYGVLKSQLSCKRAAPGVNGRHWLARLLAEVKAKSSGF